MELYYEDDFPYKKCPRRFKSVDKRWTRNIFRNGKNQYFVLNRFNLYYILWFTRVKQTKVSTCFVFANMS